MKYVFSIRSKCQTNVFIHTNILLLFICIAFDKDQQPIPHSVDQPALNDSVIDRDAKHGVRTARKDSELKKVC